MKGSADKHGLKKEHRNIDMELKYDVGKIEVMKRIRTLGGNIIVISTMLSHDHGRFCRAPKINSLPRNFKHFPFPRSYCRWRKQLAKIRVTV
jgi:hypothetical protein